MFITPDILKMLKEIVQIQSAVGQGIGRFYIILYN